MGWFWGERRGVSWKDQTLESISLPPLPLVVFFGLFIMLMGVATYSEFKDRMERGMMGFRLGVLLLPLLGFLVVNIMMLHRGWWRYAPRPVVADGGSLPWGLVAAVVVVLVLAYHQASFQSSWFRSI